MARKLASETKFARTIHEGDNNSTSSGSAPSKRDSHFVANMEIKLHMDQPKDGEEEDDKRQRWLKECLQLEVNTHWEAF